MQATSAEDTLILVTADHSHTLNFVGYPARGNPILGKVRGSSSVDGTPASWRWTLNGQPYTTLSYANGPGNTGATAAAAGGQQALPALAEAGAACTRQRPSGPDRRRHRPIRTTCRKHWCRSPARATAATTSASGRAAPAAPRCAASLEQNAIYHIVVQATPRLRAALCAKGLCDANGVPVELPKIEAFRQPAQP